MWSSKSDIDSFLFLLTSVWWGLGNTAYGSDDNCREGNSFTGHARDENMLQLQEGSISEETNALPPAAVRHRIPLHRV
jgi:hypothetical protein